MKKFEVLNEGKKSKFYAPKSAQAYLSKNKGMKFSGSGCGSACGADDVKPRPSGCGVDK